jgi:hypothetical protein
MPISEESAAEGQDSSTEDDSSETETDESELVCSSSSLPTSWGGQVFHGPSIGIPDQAVVAQASSEIAFQQVRFMDVQDDRPALEGVPHAMEQPDTETVEKVVAAEEEEEQDDIGGVTLVAKEGQEHGFRGPSLGLGERSWTTPCPSHACIEKQNRKCPCVLPLAPDYFLKGWNKLVREPIFPEVLHQDPSRHDMDMDFYHMASAFLSMGMAKGYLGESEETPSPGTVQADT